MILGDIAHVRTGDKGDTAQIAVFATDAKAFELLGRVLTPERISCHLGNLAFRSVQRFEVPSLLALNFIFEGALAGGVTRSLSLDAHGKTLGAQILDLQLIEDDESVLT